MVSVLQLRHDAYERDSEEPDSWDPMRTFGNYCFGFHVARAVAEWPDPRRRQIAWFVHGLAFRLGGFDKLAETILKVVPDVVGTPTMRRLSAAGQTGNLRREDALEIFYELNPGFDLGSITRSLLGDESSASAPEPSESMLPKTYSRAHGWCVERLESIGPKIRDFCVENGVILSWDSMRPGAPLVGSHLSLGSILAHFMEAWRERTRAQIAQTVVRDQIWAALDYAIQAGPGITLIEGDPRSGKTASTKGYADAHLDRIRYLTLESTMTDSAFFADVNRALGNPKGSAQIQKRLRAYIREVLDTKDLTLVIDEAHWLWGGSRRAVPNKINWIMTALVNRGCSVVLVVTPQFMADLGRFEKETAWAAEQWKGRIVNYVRLPSRIADDEIRNVAKVIFPEGDSNTITALSALAKASPAYLAAIGNAMRRARWLASQAGKDVDAGHVLQAVTELTSLISDLKQISKARDTGKGGGRSKSTPLGSPPSGAETPNRSDSAGAATSLQEVSSAAEELLNARSSAPLSVG